MSILRKEAATPCWSTGLYPFPLSEMLVFFGGGTQGVHDLVREELSQEQTPFPGQDLWRLLENEQTVEDPGDRLVLPNLGSPI